MKYSIIVPVYNRPDEIDELLESLTRQTFPRKENDKPAQSSGFEVIVVEDGSTVPCKSVCDKYSATVASGSAAGQRPVPGHTMAGLNLRYYNKPNSGPGQSRNYGADRASGEYLLILDSDVVLPETYLEEIDKELQAAPADAFGGPDRAHDSFTDTQKAISYSMTSFFTTGGIRGGRKGKKGKQSRALDKFYPRSFNMGIRRDVYQTLGGFSKMRFGEDIDFSIRIFKAGYRCRLFPEAWVWHKRRTDFRKFFRQVYNSGRARIALYKRYPESLKPVHLLPMVFTLGVCALVLISAAGRLGMEYGAPEKFRFHYWLCAIPWFPILLYSLLIFLDSSVQNRSARIGLQSIGAAFVQLFGYGAGFLAAWWQRCILRQPDDDQEENLQAFNDKFYK